MILGFDTAGPDTAVAICASAGDCAVELIAGPRPDGRPAHGTELLPMVERALAEAGGWDPIRLIAVGVGPGSFTGIRIAVSTARALAQARGLPLAAVSTPAAVCAGIASADPRRRGRPLIGVVDARRGELFASVDRGDGPESPVLAAPGALAAALGYEHRTGGPKALAAGDGAVRFRAEIEATGIEVAAEDDPAQRLSARQICALGSELRGGAPGAVAPDYLRRPDAERWIDGRGGN